MGRKPLSTLAIKLHSFSTKAQELNGCNSLPFERFIFSENLSDVVFVLDSGAREPGHRIVLSCGSHALRALLEDNVHFAEGLNKKKKLVGCLLTKCTAKGKEILLHDVDEEVLKFVFRFLYSGYATVLINQVSGSPIVCLV